MARAYSVRTEERTKKSIAEHKAILEAIRDRDADLAERLAREHMTHVIANLEQIGYKESQEDIKDGKN